MRRWKERYEEHGYDGLYDRRLGQPSPKRVPMEVVERVLGLYRDQYYDLNVVHFHEKLEEKHGIHLSYSWVKQALQGSGLIQKGARRGVHRRRRPRRPLPGMLLHLDGSRHRWMQDERWWDLLSVLDDATKRVLYAQLWPAETTYAVMVALHTVFLRYGLPGALYTDRAGWAFHTPKAGGPIDRTHPTQLGRALRRLGIEHIGAYSPQARGRCERLNRTVHGRLINELRVAGIATIEGANAYLRDRFIPDYNATFTRPPADPSSAFVPLGDVDLNQLLCEEEERTVGRDNVVSFGTLALQLPKQPDRPTCARLHVLVRHHLDGSHTVWRGPLCFGRFDAAGRPLARPTTRPAAVDVFAAAVAVCAPRPRRRSALRTSEAPRQRRGPRLPVGPPAMA